MHMDVANSQHTYMLFVGDEPARPIVDGDPRVYLSTVYRPVKITIFVQRLAVSWKQ